MGGPFDSLLVYSSCRTLTRANEMVMRSGVWEVRGSSGPVRTGTCRDSSRNSGRPNRTIIRQKEIPTAGLTCGGFDKGEYVNASAEGGVVAL